ncbi:MAG: tetratricopeptide repeat protein [Treponemataceae bacterium]
MIDGVKKLLVLVILAFCLSCVKKSPYDYLADDLGKLSDEQKSWIIALENTTNAENRFSAINKIAQNLKRKNKPHTLIYFLTNEVNANPSDPYNAYWLLMVANEYLQAGENKIAEYYLERSVTLYPDMIVKERSLHYLCLQNLVKISKDNEQLISYYSLLLNTLYDKINPAYAYFALGQAYEKLGEWKLAIQAYNEFVKLNQYDIVIEGIPDSFNYAKRIVDYANSSKNWVFENLDDLVETVRTAVRRLDYNTLEKCMSKVNFITRAWNQEASDVSSQVNFNLRTLMRGGRIYVSNELAAFSTDNEVYLRTSGWSQYTNVWYLYFKKVNFPADPEIHGTWEWAGIFYGEKK